jgi:hypothetical protein
MSEREAEETGVELEQSTHQYPRGTARYFGQEETGDGGRHGPGSESSEASAPAPFWEGLGFDSRKAYIDYLERQQTRCTATEGRSRAEGGVARRRDRQGR